MTPQDDKDLMSFFGSPPGLVMEVFNEHKTFPDIKFYVMTNEMIIDPRNFWNLLRCIAFKGMTWKVLQHNRWRFGNLMSVKCLPKKLNYRVSKVFVCEKVTGGRVGVFHFFLKLLQVSELKESSYKGSKVFSFPTDKVYPKKNFSESEQV